MRTLSQKCRVLMLGRYSSLHRLTLSLGKSMETVLQDHQSQHNTSHSPLCTPQTECIVFFHNTSKIGAYSLFLAFILITLFRPRRSLEASGHIDSPSLLKKSHNFVWTPSGCSVAAVSCFLLI